MIVQRPKRLFCLYYSFKGFGRSIFAGCCQQPASFRLCSIKRDISVFAFPTAQATHASPAPASFPPCPRVISPSWLLYSSDQEPSRRRQAFRKKTSAACIPAGSALEESPIFVANWQRLHPAATLPAALASSWCEWSACLASWRCSCVFLAVLLTTRGRAWLSPLPR